jgi:hypothetical protein
MKENNFEDRGLRWLNVGTRLPIGAGPMPSSGEPYRPFTDADRARVVEILNKLLVIEDPSVHPIDS